MMLHKSCEVSITIDFLPLHFEKNAKGYSVVVRLPGPEVRVVSFRVCSSILGSS